MLQPTDVDLWLIAPDASNAWPIWDWGSLSVTRGKQPTGDITVSVPYDAPWIASSSFHDGGGGYGIGRANYMLEFWVRGTLLQVARVATVGMRRGYSGAELTIGANSLWADMLKDRLILDSGTGKAESIGPGFADDIGRAYLRRQLISASVVLPTGYPHATRYQFFGLTAAVGADTASHASAITYDVDTGKNLLEWALEFAVKYDLRWTLSRSGTTVTFDVATPYTIDKTLATTGKMWTPGLGTLEEWNDLLDFTTTRNTFLIGDGTNRVWAYDSTSFTNYGCKEEVAKITTGGAASTAGMKNSELLAMAELYDGDRRVEVVPIDTDFMTFGTNWYPGTAITVAEYGAWGHEVELEVTEVTLDWQAGSDPQFKAAVGKPRRSATQELWRQHGPTGGFGAGSRFKDLNV